jgi:hypothetical protein
MSSSNQKKWQDMSTCRKSIVVVAAVVQIALAVRAWADLARRPKSEVRGRKAWWASVIGINYVGPLAYFRWGRIANDESVDSPVW